MSISRPPSEVTGACAVSFSESSSMTARVTLGVVPVARIATPLLAVAIVGGVGAATVTNTLPLVLAASALLILLVIGLRFPTLVLVLFAALIPLEDALSGEGTATATRFVGLIFAVAYVVNRRRPHLATIPAAGWAFIVWATASGLWTIAFARWTSIVTLLQLFTLALLVGDLISRDLRAARVVMWAYSASAAVTVLVFVAVPFLSGVSAYRWAAFQYQNPTQFAAVLVPAFLFLVFEISQTSSRPRANIVAALSLAGVALVGWGVIMTGGRGATIALAIGVAVMAATGTGHRRSRLLVVAVGVLAAAAALLVPGLVEPILTRFSYAAADGGAGRLDIWAVGATIFAEHPIFGVGYASSPAAFTPEAVRMSDLPGLRWVGYGAGLHSILMTTAAELGVIGVVFLGLFLWRVLNARSSLGLWNFVRAALVATLVQAMFLDMLERKQLWLLMGLALGIAAAVRNLNPDAVAARGPPETRPISRSSTIRQSEAPVAHGL